MRGTDTTRRGYLGGIAGAIATAGIAGCSARGRASLEPDVPKHVLREGGWEKVSDHEERVQTEVPVGESTRQVSVHAKADTYQNPEPKAEIAELFGIDPKRAEVPAEAFVAAKARPNPPVTRLLALSDSLLDRVLDEGEHRAKAQLREAGFTDIERAHEGRITVNTGETAAHRRYRATYEYGERTTTYRGTEVRLEPGSFDVEAQLAVWPRGGLLVSGAGAYPGETGSFHVEARGRTHELSPEFAPKAYRKDVRTLIEAVS